MYYFLDSIFCILILGYVLDHILIVLLWTKYAIIHICIPVGHGHRIVQRAMLYFLTEVPSLEKLRPKKNLTMTYSQLQLNPAILWLAWWPFLSLQGPSTRELHTLFLWGHSTSFWKNNLSHFPWAIINSRRKSNGDVQRDK